MGRQTETRETRLLRSYGFSYCTYPFPARMFSNLFPLSALIKRKRGSFRKRTIVTACGPELYGEGGDISRLPGLSREIVIGKCRRATRAMSGLVPSSCSILPSGFFNWRVYQLFQSPQPKFFALLHEVRVPIGVRLKSEEPGLLSTPATHPTSCVGRIRDRRRVDEERDRYGIFPDQGQHVGVDRFVSVIGDDH